MNWDDALIDELAARRCIIFMGSGVSAGCTNSEKNKNPPTWGSFLKILNESLPESDDKSYALNKINSNDYLEAAEIICDKISQPNFARILRAEFLTPKYTPSDIHKSILEIDPKIVVTTNYDDIYEKYCTTGDASAGYNTCTYYETHLINDLRSPVRSIIKAHGCISNPAKVVLTKHQFFKAKQESPNFFKTLDALFLTNTLLFIGYSLSDPDIQLLLENNNITAPGSHPHYLIIKKNTLHESLKKSAEKSYNIRFIEYEGNDHSELVSGMENLKTAVFQRRASNPDAY